MKIKDSTQIAIRISLAISIVTTTLLFFAKEMNTASLYLYIAVFCFIAFISFLLIKFYLEKYINERINVIFKLIHQHKVLKQKDGNEKKTVNKSIELVHQEVLDWSQKYTDEIVQLKELDKYRKEYIGNISHELKTPLFTILGYISTLIDGGLDDKEINLKYLERSETNINRLINIVHELETISQLESGELVLKKTRFDIIELTNEVIESLEIKAKNKNINIYFGKKYDHSIYVYADINQIQRLVSNLINNAIKYGFENTGKVKLSFFDMDKHILMEVTDNGPGISKTDLPRIFERFYRTDKARSRELGGTGLGLAIVKHIVEAHKQTISTRSTIGIGTTFGFTMDKA